MRKNQSLGDCLQNSVQLRDNLGGIDFYSLLISGELGVN